MDKIELSLRFVGSKDNGLIFSSQLREVFGRTAFLSQLSKSVKSVEKVKDSVIYVIEYGKINYKDLVNSLKGTEIKVLKEFNKVDKVTSFDHTYEFLSIDGITAKEKSIEVNRDIKIRGKIEWLPGKFTLTDLGRKVLNTINKKGL